MAVFIAAASTAQDTTYEYPFAKGMIETVDVVSKRITVNTTAGSRVFIVTDRSFLYRGKEKISVEKLKLGEFIKLNYFTNESGQAVVRRLKVDLGQP